MKAIVLSDIHGEEERLRRCLECLWAETGTVDAYLFCGDGMADFRAAEGFIRAHDPQAALHCVAGNCDAGCGVPETAQVTLGGVRLLLTHGHRQYARLTRRLLDRAAAKAGCAVCVYGHTHVPEVWPGRVLRLNPGAVKDGCLALLEVADGVPSARLYSF